MFFPHNRKSKFDLINELRESLTVLKTGHTNLVSMAGKPVVQRAFFPGGNGLFDGEDATCFPYGGTLILGSNFGGLDKFCDANNVLICRGDETFLKTNVTWRNLKKRFTSPQLRDCFFTNAWPFLHQGSSNVSVIHPWLKDKEVMQSCIDHFALTFSAMHPSLLVALGTGPAAFLSHVWPEHLSAWRGHTWQAINDLPIAEFTVDSRSVVCITTSHPCRPTNAQFRREPYHGEAGETKLLAEAYARVAQRNVSLEMASTSEKTWHGGSDDA